MNKQGIFQLLVSFILIAFSWAKQSEKSQGISDDTLYWHKKIGYYGWVFASDVALGIIKNFKSGTAVLLHRIIIVSTGLSMIFFEGKLIYENWDNIINLRTINWLPHFFSGILFSLTFLYQAKLGNDLVTESKEENKGKIYKKHKSNGNLLYIWGKFQVLGGVLNIKYWNGTLTNEILLYELARVALSAIIIQGIFKILGTVFNTKSPKIKDESNKKKE